MFWLLSRIAFLVAALMPAAVFAGYAQLVPPPAFQPVGPGVTTIPATVPANNFIYDVGPARKAVIPSAPMQINDYPFDNRAKYRAGFVGTRATLNVGTRTVGVPVALRVAGGAARFAVAAFNPWVAGAQLALMAVPFIIDWFSSKSDSGLVVEDGYVKTSGGPAGLWGGWREFVIGNGGYYSGITVDEYIRYLEYYGASFANAVSIQGPYQCSQCMAECGGSWPTYSWWVLGAMDAQGGGGGMPAICLSPLVSGQPVVAPIEPASATDPLTMEKMQVMADTAIDPQALAELEIPLLVDDLPILNPESLPDGAVKVGETNPAPELLPRPIRYPNGDPVLIPGTDPPLYTQPWFEVTGSPTADNPWRVNIAHVTTTTNNPAPVPDPVPGEDAPPPIPDFYTDCDKYPGVVACAGVGDAPPAEEVSKVTRQFLLQAGPSFSGYGCPANLNIGFGGHSFQVVDMAVPCSWIESLVKPIFILLSFVSAVFIVRSAL